MTAAGPLTDDQARQLVTLAGFTPDDVAAYAWYRALRDHQAVVAAADLADTVYLQVWGSVGVEVPDAERLGRGPRLTRTDCDGARRVVAAMRDEVQRRAAEPWDPAGNFDEALRSLARWERRGDHETAQQIVRYARMDRARAQGEQS